jgi:hypothetical protein
MGIAAPKQRNSSLRDRLATGWFQNQNLISVALEPAGHLHTHLAVTVGGVRQQTGNISSDDG